MRNSRISYITLRYPLVELGYSRSDCATWLQNNGFAIPSKSSCIGCPYHSKAVWLSLNAEERADAILVDEAIRNAYQTREGTIAAKATPTGQGELFDLATLDASHADPTRQPQKNGMQLYLHSSGEPLADFYANQQDTPELPYDPETEECSGMCFL